MPFFVAAFFPDKGWLVITALYFLGIVLGIIVSLIYKKTLFKGEAVPFVMELPNYRMPSARSVMQLMWEKSKDFIQRAFSVIMLASIVVWFFKSFDFHLELVDSTKDSMLAAIAGILVPIFKPIGLGDFRICTSLISGFMAKESVVSVLEVLFDEAGGVSAAISTLSAVSLLVFSLVYTPCVAAVAAIGREMGRRWAVVVVLWQYLVAWIAAFIVYYAGMLIGM